MSEDATFLNNKSATERAVHAASVRNSKTKEGLDKIRGVDPITTEIDYSRDEIEFAKAVDTYKNTTGRRYPTNHEILGILRDLGYQKIGLSA